MFFLRQLFLAALAALTCPLLATGHPGAAPSVPDKPKAVVIFIADDLGYHDTSTYGCDKVPCPHLDQLAQEGLKFTDAHSTTSVCTPSRFSLLTGQYAWRRQGTVEQTDLSRSAGDRLRLLLHPGGYCGPRTLRLPPQRCRRRSGSQRSDRGQLQFSLPGREDGDLSP